MPKLTFHGHACFEIAGDNKKVVIDPFITGNPLAVSKPEDFKDIDAVLVSHGHGDHVGDTLEISLNNNAVVVAPFELATFLAKQGAEIHPMHIGGTHTFPFGWLRIINALHGSAYIDENNNIYPTGSPCGFMLDMDNILIYHTGDTGLFGDMKIFKEYFQRGKGLDVAILPIGDNFGMGPDDALTAVKWLEPKVVVPMHYNTFPVIEQDPQEFKSIVEDQTGSECIVLNPGESFDID